MKPATNKFIVIPPETVEKIQDLIRINIDSHKGFRKAAECVDHRETSQLLSEMARERERFARDLQAIVSFNQEDPEDDGSLKGKVHRWWMELKGMVTDGDRHAMLQEAERGEDWIKAIYEEITPETASTPAYDILVAQLVSIRESHDRVKALRDAAGAVRS